MARINDVGGMSGFGTIDTSDDGAPFHADWEARVFALNRALIGAGIYNLDEFRDAVESLPPVQHLAASYYERWFAAIRYQLLAKNVLTRAELDA